MHGLRDIKCMNMEGFSVKLVALWIIRQICSARKNTWAKSELYWAEGSCSHWATGNWALGITVTGQWEAPLGLGGRGSWAAAGAEVASRRRVALVHAGAGPVNAGRCSFLGRTASRARRRSSSSGRRGGSGTKQGAAEGLGGARAHENRPDLARQQERGDGGAWRGSKAAMSTYRGRRGGVRETQRKASGRRGKEQGLIDGTCWRGPPWRGSVLGLRQGSGAGRKQRRRESAVEKLQAASLSPVRANREGEM